MTGALYIAATVMWLACAYSSWRWSRAARASQRAAHADLERMLELARQTERMVADHNARLTEWTT